MCARPSSARLPGVRRPFPGRPVRPRAGLRAWLPGLLLALVAGWLPAVEPQVATGYLHTVYLAPDGTVWTWGYNGNGQLGLGDTVSRPTPTRVPGLERVIGVAAGYFHSVALKADGTLVVWGYNGHGQLGLGDTTDRHDPAALGGIANIAQVAAGGNHTLAVNRPGGRLFAWGSNWAGQVGNGANTDALTPFSIIGSGVRSVVGGGHHSLAILNDGTMRAWGDDSQGQLGDDAPLVSKNVPVVVSGINDAFQAAAGWQHSMVMRASGQVWTWGDDGYGQLGNGGTAVDLALPTNTGYYAWRITAGYQHSLIWWYGGTTYAAGDNTYGQCLGDPATIPSRQSFTWVGAHSARPMAQVGGLGLHTVMARANGELIGWGYNGLGGLGNGSTATSVPSPAAAIAGWSLDHPIAVDAGNRHSVMLKADGTVWTWGGDDRGQLGNDLSLVNQTVPVQVGGLADVLELAAGGYHTLALKADGTVAAWGADDQGQLGNDSAQVDQPVPVQVSGSGLIRAVGAGALHSLAVTYTGAVQGWGGNFAGQLATGGYTGSAVPVGTGFANAIAVDGGYQHSLVLQANGQVQAAGGNGFGQLGNDTTTGSPTPVAVVSAMGSLSPLAGVQAIAAGQYHSVAARSPSRAWGYNGSGQLGNGTTTSSPYPVPTVTSGRRISAGADFADFTLSLLANGQVLAVGSDNNGQLGNDAAIADASSAVPVAGLADVCAIGAGDYHGLALRADGAVFSWGANGNGQLGNGGIAGQPTPVPVDQAWKPRITVTALAASASETGPAAGSIRFSRPAGNAGAVVLSYSVGGSAGSGSDYAALAGTVTIPAGALVADVVVTPVDDALDEDAETVVATLQAGAGYRIGSPSEATVSITDNDTAGVSVGAISANTREADAPFTARTFTVVLTSQPIADVTVPFQSSATAEALVDANPLFANQGASSLVFTPANWNVPRTVQVFGQQDDFDDGDVAYQIRVLPTSSDDPRYQAIDPADVSATNQDDDVAGIVVDTALSGQLDETGTGAQFTIRLTSRPYQPVGFNVSSEDTGEAQVDAASQSVILDADNWQAGVAVQVAGVDDDIDDGDQSFVIAVAKSSSADGAYNNRGGWSVAGTCADDDTRAILVSDAAPALAEGSTAAAVQISLATRPIGQTSIILEFAADAQVVVDADPVAAGIQTQLVIPADSFATGRTVLVSAVDDPDIEGLHAGMVSIAVAAPGGDYAAATAAIAPGISDDDAAGFVLSPTTTSTTTSTTTGRQITAEGGVTAVIGVRLAARPAPGATVAVTVASTDTGEGVVSTPSLVFAHGDWDQVQPVTVTGVSDSVPDGAQAYRVDFSSTSADPAFSGLSASQFMRNLDEDVAGVRIGLVGGAISVAEGSAATGAFTVRLNTIPAGDVRVDFAADGQVAVDRTSLFFTTATWNVPATVAVSAVDDLIDEAAVHAAAIAVTSVSIDPDYQSPGLSTPDIAAGVADDDTAGITVGPAGGLTTSEAGGQTAVLVALTSRPTAQVAIPVSSSDPGEMSLSVSQVVFGPSDWFIPRNVTVTGVDDDQADGDVVATVVIGRPATSADPVYAAIEPSDLLVTNRDDDTAAVVIDDGDGLSVVEGGATDAYTVVLATRPTAVVTVTVNAGSQVSASPAALVFNPAADSPAPDAWNTPRTVAVTAVDDAFAEGDHGTEILHTAAGGDYAAVSAPSAAVAIADASGPGADLPGVVLSGTAALALTEAGGQASYQIRLASQPFSNVTVVLASGDATEGSLSPSTLTFTPGDYGDRTVTLTGIDDAVADGDQAFAIQATVFSGDPGYNAIAVPDVPATTIDDDAAGLVAATAAPLATGESGAVAQFTVRLSSQPTANVTIAFASSATAEAVVATAPLVFTPADWFLPKVVQVAGVDDAVADGAATLTVAAATTAVTSADPAYHQSFSLSLPVSNQDDDVVGIAISVPSVTVTEGGAAVSVGVVLRSQPLGPVTIGVASSATAQAVATPDTLVFTAADWNVPRLLSVSAVDDALVDGAQSFSVVFTSASAPADTTGYDGLAVPAIPGTANDDDVAGLVLSATALATGEDGATAAFTVALARQPSATVSVMITGLDAGEGALSTAALVFTSADWSATRAVVVTGIADQVDDGDAVYALSLAATSADAAFAALPAVQVTVTNTDIDTAAVVITETGGGTAVSESGGSDTYTVVLASRPSGTVAITVAPDSQVLVDGATAPVVLLFDPSQSAPAAGAWDLPRTVVVSAVQDVFDEADVHAATITHAVSGYGAVTAEPVLVSVTDRPAPALVLSAADAEVDESGSVFSLRIALSTAPASTVSVVVGGGGGGEISLSATTLVFAPSAWADEQTVDITGLADLVDDGDQVVALTLSAASADPTFAAVAPVAFPVTNRDLDGAGVLITQSGGSSQVEESGGSDTYTVVLTSLPAGVVTVTVLADSQVLVDGATGAVLVFDPALSSPAPGAWNTPRNVTITAVQDVFAESTIHTGTITHAVTGYGPVTAPALTVQVIDRPVPGLVLPITSGSTGETGTSFSFTVALTTAPAATVAVSVAIPPSLADEVSVSATTLVFAPTDWSATQAVTVTGLADDVDDGDVAGALTLTTASADPTFAGLPPRQVSVVNGDIDVSELVVDAPGGVTVAETGGSATYAIRLSSRPSATVAVTLAPDGQVLAGGASAATVVLIAPADWSTGAVVTVSAAVDTVDEANPHTGRITHTVAGFGPVNGPVLTATVVDNDPPVVSATTGFTIGRSATAVLTIADLDAADDDTAADDLVFTLVLAPGQGALRRSGIDLENGDTFTRADLGAGLVVYANAGTPAVRDGFAVRATDAVGNRGDLVILEITVTGFIPPQVILAGGDAAWTEDGPATVLDVGTTVLDPDSADFKVLTVSIITGTGAADRITVRDQGTGPGQIGLVSGQIAFGGTPIGTAAGGTGGLPLTIAFNPGVAGAAAVTALIQSLEFSSPAQDPVAGPRTVSIVLRDGTDVDSLPAQRVVQVTAVNDAPAIAGPLIIQTSQGVAVTTSLAATDPDTYPLTVSVLAIPGKGVLSGLLSATGTAAIAASTASTVFTYTPSPGQSGNDAFTVLVTDPLGASTTRAIPIVITGGDAVRPWFVSDPPMVALAGSPLSYDIRLDFRDLAAAPAAGQLTFALTGTLPAGVVNGGITPSPTDPTRATLTLAIGPAATGVIQAGIIVTDSVSQTTGFQPMTVVIVPAGAGGG